MLLGFGRYIEEGFRYFKEYSLIVFDECGGGGVGSMEEGYLKDGLE